jgi:hypothetical protein
MGGGEQEFQAADVTKRDLIIRSVLGLPMARGLVQQLAVGPTKATI